MKIRLLIIGAIACFLLSFLAMGIAPWTSLRRVIQASESGANPYYDEKGELTSIGRGRKIYIKEACWHCHSQFVRPVAGEPYRYGPSSQAWEYRFDIPQTFGTRRIGPDLSREAGRRSDDWHLAHLYNPRLTVPLSVMPSYPWLFKNGKNGPEPTQDALDLVAYLQSMGKVYESQIQSIVYPEIFSVTGMPEASEVDLQRGGELFQQHCVGCHGMEANGITPAYTFLKPHPANLRQRYVSPSEVYTILNRGVLGSSMPSFREMPEKDIWAISGYVAQLGQEAKEQVLREVVSKTAAQAQGKILYQHNCTVCHGDAGDGKGAMANSLNPRPKDFTKRMFRDWYFAQIVKQGVPGTTMPPFTFNAQEMKHLHSYVSSLYVEKK